MEVLADHIAHTEVWAVRQDVLEGLEDIFIRDLTWVDSGHFLNGMSTLRLDQGLQKLNWLLWFDKLEANFERLKLLAKTDQLTE